MSRREDIDNAIWSDPDFDALSNDAQYVYLWSFTNPLCGMAGIYRVPVRRICEGRLEREQLAAALAELAEHRFLYYEAGVLWVRTRVKYLRTRTEQIAKSIEADLQKVEGSSLQQAFLAEYIGTPWLEPHVNLSRTSESGSGKPYDRTLGEPRATLQGTGKGKGTGQGEGSGLGRGNGSEPSVAREEPIEQVPA